MNRLCKAQRNILKILVINHQTARSVMPLVIPRASENRKFPLVNRLASHSESKF
jgi:hypothetical protein